MSPSDNVIPVFIFNFCVSVNFSTLIGHPLRLLWICEIQSFNVQLLFRRFLQF